MMILLVSHNGNADDMLPIYEQEAHTPLYILELGISLEPLPLPTQEVYEGDGFSIVVTELLEDYDFISQFNDGFAVVKKGRKYGFIDIYGIEVVPLEYDNASAFSEGLAAVAKDGEWMLIDNVGNVIAHLSRGLRKMDFDFVTFCYCCRYSHDIINMR
jgi:hypothetical protein